VLHPAYVERRPPAAVARRLIRHGSPHSWPPSSSRSSPESRRTPDSPPGETGCRRGWWRRRRTLAWRPRRSVS
jgi:hypothetical protein